MSYKTPQWETYEILGQESLTKEEGGTDAHLIFKVTIEVQSKYNKMGPTATAFADKTIDNTIAVEVMFLPPRGRYLEWQAPCDRYNAFYDEFQARAHTCSDKDAHALSFFPSRDCEFLLRTRRYTATLGGLL